jgi:hypothetical protein
METSQSKTKLLENVTENSDNYSWRELSCFFKPWAIIFESYKSGYFDLFLYYWCFNKHYFTDESCATIFDTRKLPFPAFFEFYEKELKHRFGLSIKTNTFISEEDLNMKIKAQIDAESPVLIPGDLFAIYYDELYKYRHHYHYFLVKGYDSEKELYYILDTVHVEHGRNAVYKDFAITFYQLYEACECYYNYFYPEIGTHYFWSVEELTATHEFTYLNALMEQYNYFKAINTNSASVKYFGCEVMNQTCTARRPSR